MKRSQINAAIRAAEARIAAGGFTLPPFADWTPDQMRARRGDIDAITGPGLGWDVTDFGQGDFAARGLALFTLRNGRAADLAAGRGMLYAEKLLCVRPGQLTPLHRHAIKAEDIINRAGGTLVVELFAADAEGGIDRAAPVRVMSDGQAVALPPGGRLRLAPGQSVTLMPHHWHAFWAEGAEVLAGEVSTVNDDATDNIFADPVSRFSRIEEDEPPYRLLVSDYPAALG